MAVKASAGNKKMLDDQRRILAKREDRERASAQTEADKLQGLQLRFERRVGEHGILFGSVTALDVAEALKERGITVERRRIGLREHIKEVGEYDVTVKLHRDVSPSIKVFVRKEGAAEEPKAVEAAPAADSAPAEPVSADLTTTPLEAPESEAEAATTDE